MSDDNNTPLIKLWLLKYFISINRLVRSKILSSMIMFFIPITCIGLYLQIKYQYYIFTYGVIISIVWTAFAPLLIYYALFVIHDFLIFHRNIFLDKNEWKKIYKFGTEDIQSNRHMIFGLFWGLSTTIVIYLVKFSTAPIAIQIWALISYFILFFVSSIGFYGIFLIVSLIKRICNSQVTFNPYHPDKFGGIASFGSFAVKGTLYFSSGALAFPLVFELLRSKIYLNLLIGGYVLFVIYLLTLIASFLIPIFNIKKFADVQKEKIILKSWNNLNNLIDRHYEKEDNPFNSSLDIAIFYHIRHSQLYKLKNYPWDLKVLIQFVMSFIIPIIITVLQMVIKSNFD